MEESQDKSEQSLARAAYLKACLKVNELQAESIRIKKELKEAKEIQNEIYLELEKEEGEDEPVTPENWRDVPIDRLDFSSIRGMGATKVAILMDEVGTIGKLVDLQAEAGGYGLATKLPEGFGPKVADKIEKVMESWLNANVWKMGGEADAPLLKPEPWMSSGDEEDDPQEENEEGEFEPNDTEIDEPENSPAESEPATLRLEYLPPAGEAEPVSKKQPESPLQVPQPMPPAEEEQLKLDRYEQLKAFYQENGCPDVANSSCYEDGRAAFQNEWTVLDCNWTAGDNQDSWLVGFIAEELSQ